MNEVEYPIDGTLDLHTFRPKDVKDLVHEYISVCGGKNILQIRIIHGKGKGNLRRTVHAILDKHPGVIRYWHEGGTGGSWGATVVQLRPN
jgi:DNA-nicking Smr family endonuclease